jgi:nucleoid DNA-binding protein
LGARKDAKLDIIKAIVLETGYTKKDVEAVVNSFLGIFQDRVSDGKTVFIRGFGQMKGVLQRKRYYDINQRCMDETIQPVVTFRPTNSFLNLIRQSQNSSGQEEQ